MLEVIWLAIGVTIFAAGGGMQILIWRDTGDRKHFALALMLLSAGAAIPLKHFMGSPWPYRGALIFFLGAAAWLVLLKKKWGNPSAADQS